MTNFSARKRIRRGGFTLVELIVAVVVLAIGVVALGSTASTVSRMLTGGAAQTLAAQVAQSRFEMLRSVPCAQVTSGTADTRGVTERWHVTSLGNRTFSVLDSVTHKTSRGHKVEVYHSVLRC